MEIYQVQEIQKIGNHLPAQAVVTLFEDEVHIGAAGGVAEKVRASGVVQVREERRCVVHVHTVSVPPEHDIG